MKTSFYELNLLLKRVLDIFFSSLLISALLPLWLIIPALICFDSKGNAFFKQKRRTQNGRVFNMLKFRTMVVNAEKMSEGLFSYKNDRRVTKVGRFLRNTSVDELPQLFNVIFGDMSLVGPRPCVVYELGPYETLNRRYKKRFEAKGGITGLAQIKGRNENSWNEKVSCDNQYIDEFKKWGIYVDLKIILITIYKVFSKENIYEAKANEALDNSEAAKAAEDEIIRIAHLPDD